MDRYYKIHNNNLLQMKYTNVTSVYRKNNALTQIETYTLLNGDNCVI